ncbi:DUF4386 family protein [Kineosporia babensis]|uniref:DUF4386 domain-containing protein n=1 Tax=Kineosporia babensis TaxID=499548 RepID=A0A9X1SWG7_9ACTN|nr:DUF4386 family protein [Kineosporia babensis]MCD5309508.1 DUF4386 domain-containing protein [Kineosporia babensis]
MSSVGGRTTARRPAALAGSLFIVATISFAIGNSLLTEALDQGARNGKLLFGVLFQTVCAIAVVVIGVILRDLLAPTGPRQAATYLGLRVAEGVVIVAFGLYFIISLEAFSGYQATIYAFTGVGGVVLCSLLRSAGAVPNWLSGLGLVGYLVLLAGVVTEFAGGVDLDSNAGFLFLAPGSVFEVVFPLLLIVRGLPSRRALVG